MRYFVFVWLLFPGFAFGQTNEETSLVRLKTDTVVVRQRSFDQGSLANYRDSNDFKYKQPPSTVVSLWDQFTQWLGEVLDWFFNGAATTPWGKVLTYAGGLFLIIVIVMLLLKVDAFRVLTSGADQLPIQASGLHEDIHRMDFDALIAAALQEKEYRLAVRLTFLQALKKLSDHQQVDWRPGKTNKDYVNELTDDKLRVGFNELSFYFEYAWYGEFDITEALYQRVRGIYNDWHTRVS
jgi:hypothetical protein